MTPASNKSAVNIDRPIGGAISRSELARSQSQKMPGSIRSTVLDRCFLFLLIVLFPLQDELPTIRGYSIIYVVFALATLYVVVVRLNALIRIFTQPLILSLLAMLAVFGLVEFMHRNASMDPFERIGEMTVGTAVVATLCRDARALRWALWGFICAGLWLSVLIYQTSYEGLRGASASDFAEASALRGQVFDDKPIVANLNEMAHVAAQGAAVSLAFALARSSLTLRVACYASCLFCAVCALLPLSRGGFLTVVTSMFFVLLGVGGKARHVRLTLVALALAAIVWTMAPEAVFARLKFNTQEVGGKQEARARIYESALTHLPEYFLTGVGAGGYLVDWAVNHGFERGGRLLGPHNSFIAVTIYWGVGGLIALLVVIWQVVRLVPGRSEGGDLPLGLRGIAITLLIFLLFNHTLYDKGLSLGMGLLIGAHAWVWPAGIKRRASESQLRHQSPGQMA